MKTQSLTPWLAGLAAAAALLGNTIHAVGPHALAADTAGEMPNIVYILADDLGYGDVGAFNAASKIATPHIDRLAADGMRFTDAHSGSAVCSPTRYGILTGRYAWRSKLSRHVLRRYDPPLIAADRLTVPALLKKHGYHTAAIGKWHLGWQWPQKAGEVVFDAAIEEGPTTRGFDYYFGTDVPNYPPYCFLENDRTVGLPSAMKTVSNLDGVVGPMLPGWQFTEILPTLAARAVRYIGQRSTSGSPFFLYLPLTSPHEPVAPSERFVGKSRISPLADFIIETDWAVGEVLAAIDRHGLRQSTLVIFTSDNGHAKYTGLPELQKHGHEPSGPLRGYKGDIWEGGHRVPFVVRWPGKVAPGSQCGETVCHTNLLATCADLVGERLADNCGEDSFSIAPLLKGEKLGRPTHDAVVHHSVSGEFAIRRGPWKLVVLASVDPSKEPALELYNLVDDLAETRNVAAEHPQIVSELTALVDQYVERGRSTAGAPQANDRAVSWRTLPKPRPANR